MYRGTFLILNTGKDPTIPPRKERPVEKPEADRKAFCRRKILFHFPFPGNLDDQYTAPSSFTGGIYRQRQAV